MSKVPYPILFNPLETLRITCPEGYNVGGITRNNSASGHLARAAVDQGGLNCGKDWLCEMEGGPAFEVVKIWTSQNVVFFQTTEDVIMADGLIGKAVLECIHMDDDRYKALGISMNKVYPQGSNFYSEGTKAASANHLHLQVGASIALVKNAYGAYRFKNEFHPYRCLWLHKDSKVGTSSYKYPFVFWPDDKLPIGELTIKTTYNRRSGPGAVYAQCKDGSGNFLTAPAGKYAVWKVMDDCYLVRPSCRQAYGGTSIPEWICCGNNGIYKPWDPEKKKAIVLKGGKWNVRKGPGTGYATVGAPITGGVTIGYTDAVQGWYKTIYGYIGPAAVSKVVEV